MRNVEMMVGGIMYRISKLSTAITDASLPLLLRPNKRLGMAVMFLFSWPLFTGSKFQSLPVNLRARELFASCKPEAHYNYEQPDQDDRGVIHVGRRDR